MVLYSLSVYLLVSSSFILILLCVIFEKLRERQQEIQDVHASLKAEMATSEKRLLVEIKSLKLEIGNRVSTLEKYKWLILGGAIVIGWILSTNFKTIIEMMS